LETHGDKSESPNRRDIFLNRSVLPPPKCVYLSNVIVESAENFL
jgi:hypothetical protein